MKHHSIRGGGDTRLHLIEASNPEGRAILFIHGFSQSSLSWERQLNSDLATQFRLVAMDMRGQGESDKPQTGYGDSKPWADDVDRTIRGLQLNRPVLCGWSYGSLVILDYIRHYGETNIAGIHIVDGLTKLGSEAALSVLTPNSWPSCLDSSPTTQQKAYAVSIHCCAFVSSRHQQRKNCSRCLGTT